MSLLHVHESENMTTGLWQSKSTFKEGIREDKAQNEPHSLKYLNICSQVGLTV